MGAFRVWYNLQHEHVVVVGGRFQARIDDMNHASDGVDTSTPSEYAVATLLGVVQGLGEFLPVSSSGHLIATSWLFGLEASVLNNHVYDVALHLGTSATLLAFFWQDWFTMVRCVLRPGSGEGRRFWLVAVASVPGAITGYLIEDVAATTLRKPLVVACTVSVMGLALYAADRWAARERTLAQLGLRDALLLGLAQAVALVPGVSRSGATMTMGRLLGFGPADTAQFSFLMAVPITFGGLVFKARAVKAEQIDGPFVGGVVVSGVTGALAIRVLRALIARQTGFLPFALYRLAFAALIVGVYLRRSGRT